MPSLGSPGQLRDDVGLLNGIGISIFSSVLYMLSGSLSVGSAEVFGNGSSAFFEVALAVIAPDK